jgi:hypothetical protein
MNLYRYQWFSIQWCRLDARTSAPRIYCHLATQNCPICTHISHMFVLSACCLLVTRNSPGLRARIVSSSHPVIQQSEDRVTVDFVEKEGQDNKVYTH